MGLAQDRGRQLEHRSVLEGAVPTRHAVEQHSQGPDISEGSRRLPSEELWCQIAWSADDHPRVGQRRGFRQRRFANGSGAFALRQSDAMNGCPSCSPTSYTVQMFG